nr:MBG domain-containing protein [uncultured Cohaesibacter sp.]
MQHVICTASRQSSRHVFTRPCMLSAVLLASSALASGAAVAGDSLPTGASVASGSVGISSTSSDMTITQGTSNAIVNWNSFSIGKNNSVTFVQPDAASSILNRVTGDTTSTIAGILSANGQVYLVNPNGIAITPTGTVKVGAGFVASTLDITDEDYLSGNLTFSGDGSSASVSNEGVITIGRGGYAALLGGSVDNSGTIAVPLGTVGLGSGEQITLDLSGDGFMQVALPTDSEGDEALVSNSGTISANGGTVIMSAATAKEAARQAINMSGVIEAKSVSGHNGSIVIGGGDGGTVSVSGKVNASSKSGTGGSIEITGDAIELTGATVDASGATGGGTINIGGLKHGADGLQTATDTTVDEDTVISADATEDGDGGAIVVWSDDLTTYAGSITALGTGDGSGGDVEVSGKALLAFTGTVDLSAESGTYGTLLLDPYDIIITDGGDTISGDYTASAEDSVIDVSTLITLLGSSDVIIDTGSSGTQDGDITVASAISWDASTTLTLEAANDITVDATITAKGDGAGLVLEADYDGDGTGSININSAITMSGASASLSMSYGSDGDYVLGSDASISFSDTNSSLAINSQAYTLIDDLNDVSYSGYYALASDVILTTELTSSLIGTSSNPFTGTFTGLGHTISGLIINSSDEYVGLFGYSSGTIRNIGLVDADVAGYKYVGALVGLNASTGTISYSYASGSVLSKTGMGMYVGGLVGVNGGLISYSYASATVQNNGSDTGSSTTYTYYTGGLVGYNLGGTISYSYATGDVTAGGKARYVGGLVGRNKNGTISYSYATGTVEAGFDYVGGLVGYNEGTISYSYASGTVTSTEDDVGGLVGYNNGTISYSYSTSYVSGGGVVGGLVGQNSTNGTIEYSYATGDVEGIRNDIGGLVGWQLGSISYAFATGDVSGSNQVGGLVGWASEGSISQTYATGSVTGNGNDVGGLVGQGGVNISYSYATGAVSGNENVGGFVGNSSGEITASYFDTDTTGTTTALGSGTSSGVTGLTTAQFQDSDYFYTLASEAGWDFTTIWTPSSEGYYPELYALSAVVWVTAGETSSTYGDSTASLDAVTSYVGGTDSYIFGESGDSLTLTGIDISFDETAAAGTNTITVNGGNGTATSTNGVTYRVVYYGSDDAAIDTAALTITASDVTKIYGKTASLTYTTSGLLNGDSLTGSLSSNGAAAEANVGTYTIGLGTLSNSNYTITYQAGTLTVDPAALTITASDLTKTYGETASLTYSTSGLTNDDTVTSVSLSSTGADASASVSSYSIDASNASGTGLSNYTISYKAGTLTVDPASLTITASDLTKTYGEAVELEDYTVSGLLNNDTITSISLSSAGADASANVGSYAISASASGTGLSNYTITTKGTVTVNPASLTITASDVTKTYGEDADLEDYTVSGLLNNDTVSSISLSSTGSDASASVGSYSIDASNASGTGLSNYTISYKAGTLTVDPASLTITASDLTKTYGEDVELEDYTVSGLLNDDAVTTVSLSSTGSDASANAGSYSIAASSASGSGLSNYTITYKAGTLTVDPAALTITASDTTKTYGEDVELEDYTVSGLLNDDAVTTVSLSSTGADASANAGSYSIAASSASGTGLSNYTITYKTRTLTVDPAALTITASDTTKTYGETVSLSYSTSGLLNDDAITSVSLSSTGADASANVGSYSIAASSASGSGLSNYTISYKAGTLTVDPASLTITASDLTKTYGEDVELEDYTVSGLLNDDAVTTVSLSSTGADASASASVSSYSIAASSASGTGLSNYTITYKAGTLTVDPAALTITASDLTKTYGETASLTYTTSGLLNGDSLTGSLSSDGAAAEANVGTYTIGLGTLGNSNYTISYKAGTLTVDPASLTITASDATKTYGETVELEDYTVSGLVNSDTVTSISLSSTGSDASANVGSYSIAASSAFGTGLSNYTITYISGLLTVNSQYGEALAGLLLGSLSNDHTGAFTAGSDGQMVSFDRSLIMSDDEETDNNSEGLLLEDPQLRRAVCFVGSANAFSCGSAN